MTKLLERPRQAEETQAISVNLLPVPELGRWAQQTQEQLDAEARQREAERAAALARQQRAVYGLD